MNYSSLFIKRFASVSLSGNSSRMYLSKISKIPTLSRESLSNPKIHIRVDKKSRVRSEQIFLKEMREEQATGGIATVEDVIDRFEERKVDMKSFERKNKLKTIGRKYFGDYLHDLQKGHDLLTWEMKEHLINLHTMDPETWTYENICYAFPVTNHEIKRLLSRKMKPLTGEKLKLHDLRVLENWKNLSTGNIGNIALLKKVINKRISEFGKETLPEVQIDPSIYVQDLFFTPTGDMHEPEMTPAVDQTSKKYWFKDIIETYEKQKDSLNKDKPLKNTDLVKCRDLNEVIQHRDLSTEETEVTVRHQASHQRSANNFRMQRRSLTWEQYKRRKDLQSNQN